MEKNESLDKCIEALWTASSSELATCQFSLPNKEQFMELLGKLFSFCCAQVLIEQTRYQTITEHRRKNGKINLKNGIDFLAWQRIVEIAVQEKPFVTLVIIIKSS